MLRNEPPFTPLRLRALYVECSQYSPFPPDEVVLRAFAADMARHASLKRVALSNVPLDTLAVLDAVVDAALEGQFVSLTCAGCRLSPASAPALARLLGSGALTELNISQNHGNLLDAPSAALLGDALRANSTLTTLSLSALSETLWLDADTPVVFLSALTGHRSLRALRFYAVNAPPVGAGAAVGAAFGVALGTLVAANAFALMKLDVAWSNLSDAILRPLFEALPANTHLQSLDCERNNLSEAFVHDVLLPAVRANTSLRMLSVANASVRTPVEAAAEDFVRNRAEAEAAATNDKND
jgi:hypothetical protein